jgi:hypothetical protein
MNAVEIQPVNAPADPEAIHLKWDSDRLSMD